MDTMPSHHDYMRAWRAAAERNQLDDYPKDMSEAKRLITQLRGQVEALNFELTTFKHGHSIAAHNCVRLERELASVKAERLDSLNQPAPADVWREAVYDACTVAHIGWDSGDPRRTIDGLIDWHVNVALDPQVSSDAKALIEQGYADGYSEEHGRAASQYHELLAELAEVKAAHAEAIEQVKRDVELAERFRVKYDLRLKRSVAMRAELSRLYDELAQVTVRAELATAQLTIMDDLREHIAAGTVRLNVIADDTVPPGTMIVEKDGRQSLTITGITAEDIEAIAASRKP